MRWSFVMKRLLSSTPGTATFDGTCFNLQAGFKAGTFLMRHDRVGEAEETLARFSGQYILFATKQWSLMVLLRRSTLPGTLP